MSEEKDFFIIPEKKDRQHTYDTNYKANTYHVEFMDIGYRTTINLLYVNIALRKMTGVKKPQEDEDQGELFHIKDVPVKTRPRDHKPEQKYLDQFVAELNIKLREQAHLSMSKKAATRIFFTGYERLQEIIHKCANAQIYD
ncbi:MAG: hypothetical protein ACP5N2_07795 [Candidatus Nanoarchaeia archaeon]